MGKPMFIPLVEKPRWIRDLIRFLPLKSQFVLSGNVRDQYPVQLAPDTPAQVLPLVSYVATNLLVSGIRHFIGYDPAQGFWLPVVVGLDRKGEREFFQRLEIPINESTPSAASPEKFFEVLERVVRWSDEPIAMFADFASRMLLRPDLPTEAEQRCFTRALVLGHAVQPRPIDGRPFYNPIIWIVEKEGDLPDWFVVGNPRIRQIPVPKPDHVVRHNVANTLGRTLRDAATLDEHAHLTQVRAFVDATDGLLVVDLSAIALLSRAENLGLAEIEEAVRRYKLGVTEDPWRRIDREKLRGAEDFVRKRVKGQTHAVTHMLDIVKRAAAGFSGHRPGGRPRGVAFLAGPTGVGKTELAKTVTSLLFGDESAYIRFDMSEFSAEHSDQRLIGAPPGYVGYDVGGELTNAIRQRPFSVVLFDEIEKAHPRILDKFLQVLDDGVLTSGRGERVYFSEAFLVFTSNLGIYRLTASGEREPNVTPADRLDVVRANVRAEIDRHFKLDLGRPEILNRIGENIIVFDFIRDEVAEEIFISMLESIIDTVRASQQVEVSLSDIARNELRALCLGDLSNGGRGIRNQLEAHLVNPLARALFDGEVASRSRIEIAHVDRTNTTNLQWRLIRGG
jgi:energy-coupling factor transporter ATP-binding protein EcfA2